MLMATVQARLLADPPVVARVQGAAALAQLTEKGALAQAGTSAFVVPMGIGVSEPDAVTGLYRQPIDRLVGVVIAVRNLSDATGGAGFAELDPLVEATIERLCGWAPGDEVGVLRLVRGELIQIVAGTITYQLSFALADQLRIAR